jgi:F-type H+-transporting ATPase subunit b
MTFLAFAENSIQLVPDGTLFLHIAIILVMVFVLNATLFKPINRILEEREKRTRGRTGEARDILQRVEEKMAQYENTLREARAEGYRLMEQERTAAMNERQAKLSLVREDINRLVTEQKQSIQTQVEEARATLERDARRLAAEIGAQILNRPISESVTSSVSLGA